MYFVDKNTKWKLPASISRSSRVVLGNREVRVHESHGLTRIWTHPSMSVDRFPFVTYQNVTPVNQELFISSHQPNYQAANASAGEAFFVFFRGFSGQKHEVETSIPDRQVIKGGSREAGSQVHESHRLTRIWTHPSMSVDRFPFVTYQNVTPGNQELFISSHQPNCQPANASTGEAFFVFFRGFSGQKHEMETSSMACLVR
ncbi:hypothetical protein SCOR_03740 [Sulfidibacter corallicola]